MENVEVANALNRVADLLEIQGANPFRVRAYRNAARTIDSLPRPVAELVAEGADLKELPGIGEDLSAYITELVRTGRLKLLQQLERRMPASLTELMTLDGIGPKRARQLHDELGVDSLAELREALKAGKVEGLRGFGEKTVARIRRAVEERIKRARRSRLADADQFVRPLLAYMAQAPGVEAVEAAGSYRRRMETVGDIDLLAIAAHPAPAMRHFTAYPGAARVEAAGTTRGTIVLRSGLHVDLRIVPRRSYGAALHYFTGSKAHNIEVRRLGIDRGLRISEYGVFRMDGEGTPRQVGGAREQDVFRAVGLRWIPPELRENRGEIEAARAGRLPDLVEHDDLRGDLQMHSTWSDGHDSIEAMARAALDRGYSYIAITDHSRSTRIASGLTTDRLEEQWREIARVRRRVKGLRILRGMEVEILEDGSLDLPDAWLRRLDVVVIGVHSHMRMSRERMTTRVIRAMSHPAVNILAHPSGRLIGRRDAYEIDVDAVLRAAAELDVAIEVNAQPDRLDLSDVYLHRARELGVRIAIDSDAHSVDQLRFIEYGVAQARRGWLEAASIVNTMDLDALEQWLTRRRSPQRRSPRRRSPQRRSARRTATTRS